MIRLPSYAALVLLAGISFPPDSRADDLAALKAEVATLKADYAARVGALEQRITQLESAASVAQAAPPAEIAPEAAAAAAPEVASSQSAATAFNPAMSMIFAGNFANVSDDPDTWHMQGFIPNDGEVGPGDRSFNVGESELTVAANVDPYFFGNVTASVSSDNEIEVEEAYFKTIALPAGLSVKGGRFFSGLGYLNEIHAHAWDFVDQPLVYQAFFGGQLVQDGLQFKWLAPTVMFIELGAETGNGQAFPGTRLDRNGLNGGALFVHVGDDIGDSTSWRAGLSYLDLDAEDRAYEDTDHLGNPVTDAFTGQSHTWVADFTLKWSPHGNPTQRALKLQGEYMRRKEDGQLAFDTSGLNLADSYRSEQSGWYVQGAYQFQPRWRVGARYDVLDSGDVHIGLVDNGVLPAAAFPLLLSGSPTRVTLMLDFSPSEFSRLRAQYAWDDARDAGTDHQIQLQYIYSLGAHGAHKF